MFSLTEIINLTLGLILYEAQKFENSQNVIYIFQARFRFSF